MWADQGLGSGRIDHKNNGLGASSPGLNDIQDCDIVESNSSFSFKLQITAAPGVQNVQTSNSHFLAVEGKFETKFLVPRNRIKDYSV